MEASQQPRHRNLHTQDMQMLIAILVKKLGGAALITEDEITRAMDPTITTHSHRRGFVIEAQIDD